MQHQRLSFSSLVFVIKESSAKTDKETTADLYPQFQ